MKNEKSEIAFGHLGNGYSVYDRFIHNEKGNELKSYAHIKPSRVITWKVRPLSLPLEHLKKIIHFALFSNGTISVTQDQKVLHTPYNELSKDRQIELLSDITSEMLKKEMNQTRQMKSSFSMNTITKIIYSVIQKETA